MPSGHATGAIPPCYQRHRIAPPVSGTYGCAHYYVSLNQALSSLGRYREARFKLSEVIKYSKNNHNADAEKLLADLDGKVLVPLHERYLFARRAVSFHFGRKLAGHTPACGCDTA